MKCTRNAECEQDEGHDSPCPSFRFIPGVTTCKFCGRLDGTPECECWTPVADVPDEVWERSGLKLVRPS